MIIFENEGHEIVFDYGDHNVLVKESFAAGHPVYEDISEKVLTEKEADEYIGKLIRLGYQRGN